MAGVNRNILAYVIGLAIGDGNLSNPNGRATRLRITCDIRYPSLIRNIQLAIQTLLLTNKVTIVKRSDRCLDISCYSNKWEDWLGWKANNGSKFQQHCIIPDWIRKNRKFKIRCLKGLIETDGSVYYDRGYKMVNFIITIPKLAHQVLQMILQLGFHAHIYTYHQKHRKKHTIRVSKNTSAFIKTLDLVKQ